MLAPNLTLAQRVDRATALLRVYVTSVATDIIRQQKAGVVSKEDMHNFRWLTATLEQLALPLSSPDVTPLLSLQEKFDLLCEAARRYPLLNTVAAPFQLYPGPDILRDEDDKCCDVYWGDIINKPDVVTYEELMFILEPFRLSAAKIFPFLEPGPGISISLTDHNTILFSLGNASERQTGIYACPDYNVYKVHI
jgi:hypothetical protein